MYRPFIQVRSNALIKYDGWCGDTHHNRYNLQVAPHQPYNGEFSDHARRRLMSAIDILVQRNPSRQIFNTVSETWHPFNINFTTLTIASPYNISARTGYDQLLSKYIRYMRDKYGLKEYVWKAELQQRGQLHYHLCGNVFIPWYTIRWKWNKVQREAGLLNDYARKYGDFNPNSTDVHVVENQKDIYQYVSKEICKSTFLSTDYGALVKDIKFDKSQKIYTGQVEEEPGSDSWVYCEWTGDKKCITFPLRENKLVEPKLNGRIWDASEKLKMSRFKDEMDSTTWSLIRSAERDGKVKTFGMEKCEVIKHDKPLELLSPLFRKKYEAYIRN